MKNGDKNTIKENLNPLYQAVIAGDSDAVKEKIQERLDNGEDPETILHGALIPAMDEVGFRYESGEYFVPEMLIAARAMKAALGILKPLLVEKKAKPLGKVLFGTVKGDIHDIGKNLVVMMLEGAGFDVKDMGVDVLPEAFVASLQEEPVDIVALSALITTTLPAIKTTIDAICDAGLRDHIKIIIGGAPVTPDFAREVGADGTAIDAGRAVKLAKSLITQ